MEYKVNIPGVPNVDLFTDESSAKKLVASVSGVKAAKRFAESAKFSDKLIKVEKVTAKKKVAAKKKGCKKDHYDFKKPFKAGKRKK